MKTKLQALASPISLFLLSTAALAAPLCPQGAVYMCKGGINGVQCWCQYAGGGAMDITMDYDAVADVVPPGTIGLELALQSRILEDSKCQIHYKLGVKVFDGEKARKVSLGLVTLSSETPDVLISPVPMMRGIGRATHSRVYYTLIGKGEARECDISEVLSLTTTMVTYDANGQPNGRSVVTPRLKLMPDDGTPPEEFIPPIFPPNPDVFDLQ
jgi:hypothetical protein